MHGVEQLRQVLIVTRDETRLVTSSGDAPAAMEVIPDAGAIYRYGTFFVDSNATSSFADLPKPAATFEQALVEAIGSLSPIPRDFGIDIDDASINEFVRNNLLQARFSDARTLLLSARAVKLPGELDLLRYASKITDEAIDGTRALIAHGVSELEIAAEISGRMVRKGGVPRFVVVTTGARSAYVDACATQRTVERGDTVRLDVGCSVQGYHSDMARTFVVGEPDAKQSARYEALLLGEQAQLAALRPGVLASQIYETAVGVVRRSGLPSYRRHHCGHGIGLAAHEFPVIGPASQIVLEPGMVLCVETPYYEIGWGGMMVEDTAIITESGCELLTTSSRDLRLPNSP